MNTESDDSTKAKSMEHGLSVSLLATSAQQSKQSKPVYLTCKECRWSIGTNIPNELLCQRTMYVADKRCDAFSYEPGTVL